MPTEEAIDLIRTLPNGSSYVASVDPLRSWSDERNRNADVLDAIMTVAWALGAYDRTAHPEPPKVTRPRDLAIRRQRAQESRAARSRIENGEWEEM